LFRWTIVLPEDALRTFEPSELYALLAHEAAHLVRGDAVWLWIGRIICSCFAIQPLNFVARREWRRSSEMLCDEWAVRHSASGLALARCLTRVAESNSLAAPRLAALWALGTPSHLSQRVERLLDGARDVDAWGTRTRRRLVTVAGVAIATVFVCAAPRTTVLGDVGGPDSATRSEVDGGPLSLARSEPAVSIRLLGSELRELSSEIDQIRELSEARRPGDRKAAELSQRISARAIELEARYRHLAKAAAVPSEPNTEKSNEAR
jgi:hypothetical protein